MKTTFKMSQYFILASLTFIMSCGSDDDGGGGGINVQNLVTNFDENPMTGATVGTIQAASGNTLSFSITSQTPTGSLNINPSTGELTVANASVFDFETNPVINASISIIDPNNTATATATINLNNLDDIAHFLSTSEAAYTAATGGDWVAITESEYNILGFNLNEVSKVSTSDSNYDDPSPLIGASSGYTWSNENGPTMPIGSFAFAFKYISGENGVTSLKVKQSNTSTTDGYSDLGNVLPSHDTGENYFVLKGNNMSTTNTGYLGLYTNSGLHGKDVTTGGGYNYFLGDGDSLPNSGVAIIMYQGLSTTQKQW